jgi:hypothetical protein
MWWLRGRDLNPRPPGYEFDLTLSAGVRLEINRPDYWLIKSARVALCPPAFNAMAVKMAVKRMPLYKAAGGVHGCGTEITSRSAWPSHHFDHHSDLRHAQAVDHAGTGRHCAGGLQVIANSDGDSLL